MGFSALSPAMPNGTGAEAEVSSVADTNGNDGNAPASIIKVIIRHMPLLNMAFKLSSSFNCLRFGIFK